MSVKEFLQAQEAFVHFPEPALDAFLACLARSHFNEGEAIFRQGDPTQSIYIIERGGVRIQRETPYGVFSLADLHTGDLFGETSFVDGDSRSGDAVALCDSDLLSVSPVALAAALENDPRLHMAVYWAVWKSLSVKLRDTNVKLTQFFSETGRPPSAASPDEGTGQEEFRVDMAAKRRLFQEQRLSNLEINFLTSLSREEKLAPGQLLFREGDPGDQMYIVLEGRIMISKYIPGAGEEALAFLERGDYFGEMALIDKQPRSADAKAHGPGAVVLAIPREVLEGILDIGKLSSLRLLKILCSLVAKRLRELDDKLVGWFILAGGSSGSREPSGGHPSG